MASITARCGICLTATAVYGASTVIPLRLRIWSTTSDRCRQSESPMSLASLPLIGSLFRRLDARIGMRLGSSFGALGVLMIVMVSIAAWQMNALLGAFTTAVDDRVPILAKLQSLAREVSAVNLG